MSKSSWKKINDTDRAFIIAEAGVNHNGDIDLAKKLIDCASDVGADAVKFQTFKTEKLVTRNASKAEYQMESTGTLESQFDMLQRLELSAESHSLLFDYCTKKDILFMSAPFDPESADFLNQLGIKIFKVPSGELNNLSLLEHIAQFSKPIIVSTGMSTLGEVSKAVNVLNKYSAQFALLHCVSNYPANPDEMNLRAMQTMREEFDVPIGLSDHTLGIEIPLAAVSLGACIIEKHFTLDKTLNGPDHKASLDPDELKAMIQSIRKIERAFGNGEKIPSQSEEAISKVARKSIVAACEISKDEVFSQENITLKRPGTGLSPEFWEDVIGKKAKRNFLYEEFIEL